MRTTLTLDEDVAAKLKKEAQRSGRSFKEIVNELLRLGLHTKQDRAPRAPFRVETRDMGNLRQGLDLDDIGGLLEQIEGPTHR